MAMRPVIRMGDSTSHGGTVLEGHANSSLLGKPIAGVGHKVHCPKCKGSFPIVAGSKLHSFMGKNTALEGMETGCGAVLIASQNLMTVDDGGVSLGNTVGLSEKVAKAQAALGLTSPTHDFDRFFQVVDQDGKPVGDLEVLLVAPNGQIATVRTDEGGNTTPISGAAGESAELVIQGGTGQ